MSEPRLWWQRIRRWRLLFLIGVGALIVLIVLIYGVRFDWGWTGFAGGYGQVTVKGAAEDKVYLPSKTLWDWMQLLLVPVMLAVGGFWLNQLQKNREDRVAKQRDKTGRDIAADNQREAALQSYIDKIGELLLRESEPLGASPGDPQVENIARARTVTVLRILDPGRSVSLLRFLSQAGILQLCTEGDLTKINLSKTNLVQFDLSKFSLSGADLSGADLSGADLSRANLFEANLSEAKLSGAKLSGAKLSRADLSRANLFEANLSEAKLSGAKLSGAKLILADLIQANLIQADLTQADLSGANLSGAILVAGNLSGADLSGANLTQANLNETELSRANLSGANLSEARFNAADLSRVKLYGAKGLTDEQRANYQSRGASVDPISSEQPSNPPASPPTSSTPPRDEEQSQSPTFVQVAETPPSAGDTTLPIQEKKDGAVPPTQPDFPS